MKNSLSIEDILSPISDDQISSLSRKDLEAFAREEQKIRLFFRKESESIKQLNLMLQDEKKLIKNVYILIKNKLIENAKRKNANSTDRENIEIKEVDGKGKAGRGRMKGTTFTRLPSERYPDADIIEKRITFEEIPNCECCNQRMKITNLTEVSESLTVIPKKFIIERIIKEKFNCPTCQSSIKTPPSLPRISPLSSYSDQMIIDVALSKFCDLIPIEGYALIAERSGFPGIPPHSLINVVHALATFVEDVYKMLREEILKSKCLSADETTHRMLEGHEKSKWYFWGLSTQRSCYFECHPTRSADIAIEILKNSACVDLLSDAYVGYSKTIRLCNKYRAEKEMPLMGISLCNAHSYRKFKEVDKNFEVDAAIFVKKYKEIYKIEEKTKDKCEEEILKIRSEMIPIFEEIKRNAEEMLDSYSTKSDMYKAMNYFLNNYTGLISFTTRPWVPIDNNRQESLFRNYVVGRKCWYGTHSLRGSHTTEILFSIIESCKLNKINPRIYFKDLVESIHYRNEVFTPKQYIESKKIN